MAIIMAEQNHNDISLEIDQSTIKDFFDEFTDMYELLVAAIEELEAPENYTLERINSVFRGVHTIKSNLHMVGLNSLSETVHNLENLLDQIRQNQCKYIPEYGDVVRLVLDETKISSEKYFNHEPATEEFVYIANTIEHMCNNPQSRQETVEIALKLLDPLNKGKPLKQKLSASNQFINTIQSETITTSDNSYQYIIADLNFFQQISLTTEKRISNPLGKLELISKVCLKMNEIANLKVDSTQLQAAVYLHNFGLSTLPLSIIKKTTALDNEETAWIQKCPQISADLLKNLPFWQPAAIIIEQSHERHDGLGYPNKLHANKICAGAKILAIAVSFATIFYSKPCQQINTRSIMAAILAINNEAGSQFDEYWADMFNQSIKTLHQEQQLIK